MRTPHTDEQERVAVVHNGIIENYLELKQELLARGHQFRSETDTEVLAHLIEEQLAQGHTPEEAVRRALLPVRGSYAIAVLFTELSRSRGGRPQRLAAGDWAGRRRKIFIASDIPALLPYTRRVILLENGDVGVVTRDSVRLMRLDGAPAERPPVEITWSAEAAEKGGHEHFMIKEILEQPEAVRDTLRGRLKPNGGIQFPELKLEVEDWQKFPAHPDCGVRHGVPCRG
jgi:glucosamine--fructose-6-phosphate aminotransferase (isomerizing)